MFILTFKLIINYFPYAHPLIDPKDGTLYFLSTNQEKTFDHLPFLVY